MTSAQPAEDWATSLVRVKPHTLARGDVVYERHAFGKGPGDVKWNKGKVRETAGRASVTVEFESGRVAILHCADLWHEPQQAKPAPLTHRARIRAAPPPPPPSEPPPPEGVDLPPPVVTRRVDEDEYTAWMAMGRDMLAAIDRQRTSLDRELVDLSAQLDTLDTQARRRIEALEAELQEAKREHQDDRAFAVARQEQLTGKLATLNERRHAMAALMGEP